MSILHFALITFLGATIWCGVLVYLGWTFGNEVVQLVQMYTHEIGIISIVLIGFWLWYKIFYKRKE
jgi:membrane protein DedA with SNARE-associated domain